jgi:hypothetical protein
MQHGAAATEDKIEMSAASPLFHTATFEQPVPGAPMEMAAVAYNLQYTKPLVEKSVERNPPERTDVQVIPLRERELVRATHIGNAPDGSSRRICTIGVGDGEQEALRGASGAWFEYHASTLFSQKAGRGGTHRLAFQRPVPGAPAPRMRIVGVAYELGFMQPAVQAAVTRNRPTRDELVVVEADDLTLMRVNLFGLHPLETNRRIGVAGIADRHYRAVAAAEQAWADFHTSLLFGAQAISAL